MASPSKEENILKLILENSPLKEWRFKDIVQKAKVTKIVASKWLKKYVAEGILIQVKEKGKFPYYTAGAGNFTYQSKKRIYALEKMHDSGLIPGLLSIKTARTIIVFGSMIKGDWYKDSDIDVFVLGDTKGFDKRKYESKLHKNIELHIFQDKQEIDDVKTSLIKNVMNGYVLKGQIQDISHR